MSLKTLYKLFFACGVLIILNQCTTQKVNQSSSSKLYKKANTDLASNYCIYHINDSISQLFYNISNESLIYKKTDTSNYFYSFVKIYLQINTEDNLNNQLDTASLIIRDRQTNVLIKNLKGSLLFNLKKGKNYFVNVNVFDFNKRSQYTHSMYADKTNPNHRQNFLITNSDNEVYYTNYFKPNETVYISSHLNTEKLFNVDYFKSKFKLAPPPFSTEPMQRFNYKPDSVFSVYSKNDKIELSLPNTGFYHLKTDEKTRDGVTFYIYEPSFPKIKDAEQMILSTRYIMAKREFDNCINAADKKAAIDKFWVDIGGSNERAMELLKKYYARVQEANKTFTSFQEGWKTDRGMIYIVFGAPNSVTKLQNGEIWTFGEAGTPNSTEFAFTKVINPFTDNDFYLERGEVLKMPWYQAVDTWRQGRIYLDN